MPKGRPMSEDTDPSGVTSLTLRDSEFTEIAQTVIRAMNDLTQGVSKVAADTIITAVREAYLKGYDDGYRQGLLRGAMPGEGRDG
jgi:hypothetical protein